MSRLYISDLDGTLLRSNATLSEFSRSQLERLLADGVLFTLASARSVVSMRLILGDFPLRLPVIANNGAFLSDLRTGEHRIVHALAPGLAPKLLELAGQLACPPVTAALRGPEERLYIPAPPNAGMQWYLDDRIRVGDPRRRPWETMEPAGADTVVSMSFIAERERIEELGAAVRSLVGEHVATNVFENHYTPGWFWLVAQDRRATKDQAIRDLVELEGLSGRELVAFGDQLNDLAMFDAADVAVAVGNAADEVKARADEVIGTNDEDAVVRYVLGDRA